MLKTSQKPVRRTAIPSVMLAISLALAAPTSAQDTGARSFVTGTEWERSAERSKMAYVLGIADLMNAEFAYQSKQGRVSDSRSTISRLHSGFSDVSIGEAVARVDAFYQANPDQMDETVLEALWITLVEEGTQ